RTHPCLACLFCGPVVPATLRSCPARRSSDLLVEVARLRPLRDALRRLGVLRREPRGALAAEREVADLVGGHELVLHRAEHVQGGDRKSTRLNSSHVKISYAVFCLKEKTTDQH